MARANSACRSSFSRPRRQLANEALFGHVAALMDVRAQLHHLHLRGRRHHASQNARRRSTQVKQRHGVPVASHLTCVGSTVDQLARLPARGERARRRSISSPCAAIRRAAKRRSSRSPADCATPTNSSSLVRERFPQLRHRRGRLSRKASGSARAATDLANLKRKVDARRRRRRHAALLQQRRLLRLSRAARTQPAFAADRAGHAAGDEPRADPTHHVALRREAARRRSSRRLASAKTTTLAVRSRRRVRRCSKCKN